MSAAGTPRFQPSRLLPISREFPMLIDDATWELVRLDYQANDLTIRLIAKRYAVSHSQIYSRAKAEGWPLRGHASRRPYSVPPAAQDLPAEALAAPGPAAASPPAEALAAPGLAAASPPAEKSLVQAPRTRKARFDLINRLYHAIDLKLSQMEKHMEDPLKKVSSGDHERETRAIGGLVRSLEHVTELNADLSSPNRKSSSAPPARAPSSTDATGAGATGTPSATTALPSDPAGTERLRLELARRLEVILQKQTPPADAG